MACPVKVANYVRKTLSASAAANATTLTVTDSSGFPALAGGEYFYLVLSRVSDAAYEVVKVTAVSDTSLTVVRAQEGTTALAFSSGDRAELWLTAGSLYAIVAYFQGLHDAYAPADGSITGAKLADATVTYDKLAATLNLAGKTLTMPANRMPKVVAEGSLAATAPDYVGQIAMTTGTAASRALVGYALTNGSWIPMEKVLTSISAAPNYVGQCALVSGVFYFAKATSAASDWVPLSMSGLFLSVQGSDLDSGVAGLHSVYVKEVSGSPHLWFKVQGGATFDITAAFANTPAAYNAPDWDSGWTKVTKSEQYDLSNTSFGRVGGGGADEGGFSKTSGKTATGVGGGMTNASAEFANVFTMDANRPGWRFAHVLLKPINGAGPVVYNSHLVLPVSWAFNYGGSSYCTGFAIGWDSAAGKPYFKTAKDYLYYDIDTTKFGDWTAITSMTSALVRVQAWK